MGLASLGDRKHRVLFIAYSISRLWIFNCIRADNEVRQPMIPTYVFGFPTGEELGDYLAVDLGTSFTARLPTFTIISYCVIYMSNPQIL